MIIAGGIVSLKPIGGLISNNPNMTDAQAQAHQQAAAERAAQKQAAVDALVNKFADNNTNNNSSSSTSKKDKITCNNCNNNKDFDIEEGNIYICLHCSSQQFILRNVTSYKDINRINISTKYMYDRKIHFRDCINQYQGKQNSSISQEVYDDLIREFESHHLIEPCSDGKNSKERFKNITKEHISIFLKELSYTKHYENINLIHYNLTGIKPDDIG